MRQSENRHSVAGQCPPRSIGSIHRGPSSRRGRRIVQHDTAFVCTGRRPLPYPMGPSRLPTTEVCGRSGHHSRQGLAPKITRSEPKQQPACRCGVTQPKLTTLTHINDGEFTLSTHKKKAISLHQEPRGSTGNLRHSVNVTKTSKSFSYTVYL